MQNYFVLEINQRNVNSDILWMQDFFYMSANALDLCFNNTSVAESSFVNSQSQGQNGLPASLWPISYADPTYYVTLDIIL